MRMLTHGLHEIPICPSVAVDGHHVSVHASPLGYPCRYRPRSPRTGTTRISTRVLAESDAS
jgi:hypothetical protein